MLSPVLRRLKSIGEITVTADQYRHIVKVVPAKLKKVGSQHYIDALLHRDTLGQLGSPQADLQIGCFAQDIEELLLLRVALGPLAWVSNDIIVVGPEQLSRSAEATDEFGEVEVNTPEIIA